MKLVLFSDLHLDATFAWIGSPAAARKRRIGLRDALDKIIDLVIRENADALLCGGDLYEHDRQTPDTAAFLAASFARIHPTRVFIAPGNHDWFGPDSIYRRAQWSPNVHIFDESKLQAVELADGLTLWGGAHTAPSNTPGFLETFLVDRDGINLALFHGSELAWLQEQEAEKIPHAPFRADQIAASGLDHAFLGHYHRPRAHDLFTYPGNPDPLTFGEDGVRGAVVVMVSDGGGLKRQWIPVAVNQVHDIHVDITGTTNAQQVKDQVQSAVHGLRGSARVTVEGEMASEIDLSLRDLEGVPSDLDSVLVRIGDINVGYDLDAIAEEATVRGEFIRSVRSEGLGAGEAHEILITGLRAFEGRDDLAVT